MWVAPGLQRRNRVNRRKVVSREGIEPSSRRLRVRQGSVHWVLPHRFPSENRKLVVHCFRLDPLRAAGLVVVRL
jgi:hypothetical protein